MPLLIALAFLAAFSGHRLLPLGFLHTTSNALQLHPSSNCTSKGGDNESCNGPPVPDITDGATSTTVLRLANKVSVQTVDKVLDAATSERPGQTVRVSASYDSPPLIACTCLPTKDTSGQEPILQDLA